MLNGEITSIILFFIGVYGIIARRNMVKSIISIGIMEMAIILFLLSVNFEKGMRAPVSGLTSNISDPLPQALMITAIIIGVAVNAIGLSLFINIYHKYGTTNWTKAAYKRRQGGRK